MANPLHNSESPPIMTNNDSEYSSRPITLVDDPLSIDDLKTSTSAPPPTRSRSVPLPSTGRRGNSLTLNTSLPRPHRGNHSSSSAHRRPSLQGALYPQKGADERKASALEARRRAWVDTAKAAAVVMALFAGAETQLLPDMTPDKASHLILHKIIRVLSYSGLLVNLGGTLCAMLLLDMLGDLRVNTMRKSLPALPPSEVLGEEVEEPDLAAVMGDMGSRWRFCKWHFIFSLFTGSAMIFIQIGIMAYLDEQLHWFVAGPVIAFAVVAAAPFLVFISFSLCSESGAHGEVIPSQVFVAPGTEYFEMSDQRRDTIDNLV